MITRFLIPLFALCLGSAVADETPDWMKELGPAKPGKHPALPAGKLVFDLSWKGLVDSANLQFDIGKKGAHKPGVIVIQSKGKSKGMGGKIFPYKGNGWSEINASTLRPNLLTATESKRGDDIKTDIRFTHNQVSFKEVTTDKKDKKTEKSHVFEHGPVYDIGSAILFIRSQKLEDGDEINLMLHPYSSPYLLNAKVLGREKLDDTECIKLSLALSKIKLKNLELKPYKKLKKPAKLWLSDDDERLPMELRCKVFIGDIRATLQGFEEA